jgi:hypothetical protein
MRYIRQCPASRRCNQAAPRAPVFAAAVYGLATHAPWLALLFPGVVRAAKTPSVSG